MRQFILRSSVLFILPTLLSACAISPVPLSTTELDKNAESRLNGVVQEQEPISGPIDLYEAMARALKYNLDHHVEIYEASLRTAELDLSHYSLLPKIVGSAGFDRRNNFNASSSLNLATGNQNFGASTSRDRDIRERDLEISWDVLDFGLSYVRARQTADKVLIARENRRKVVNRIIENVRTAYWRAMSAQRLMSRLGRLEARTRRALRESRRLENDRQTSPITALSYERELVEIKRTIRELQRDLSVAKSQLAALMNVVPGTKFRIQHPSRYFGRLRLKQSVEDMIWSAMLNRPELREVSYRQRINVHEAHAAMLELLPNFRLFASTNYNSNSFLLNNHWLEWGSKASWHLLNVMQYPAKRAVIEAQDDLLRKRALALSMAVITQVHVSRIRFYHYARDLSTAHEYLDVQRRLVQKMRVEAAAGRISEQTLIREEMNTLVAEVKRDITHAGLQNAYGNVFASIGMQPVSDEFDLEMDVKALASSLRSLWKKRGDAIRR